MEGTNRSKTRELNMEHKLLQGGGTAQPNPSELERTSSFEAWLSPDALRLYYCYSSL
jgi:hypothetical protein